MCEYCEIQRIEFNSTPDYIELMGRGRDMGGVCIDEEYGVYRLYFDGKRSEPIRNCPMCGRLLTEI